MKLCGTCKAEKPYSEFHRKRNGRQSKCKQCVRAYHRKHYLENKKKYLEQAANWRKGQKDLVTQLKINAPCLDCDKSFHPAAMEFDHREGEKKIGCIATMVGNVSTSVLFAEIAKCDLVCAICHRMRTLERMDRVARLELAP